MFLLNGIDQLLNSFFSQGVDSNINMIIFTDYYSLYLQLPITSLEKFFLRYIWNVHLYFTLAIIKVCIETFGFFISIFIGIFWTIFTIFGCIFHDRDLSMFITLRLRTINVSTVWWNKRKRKSEILFNFHWTYYYEIIV